MTKKDYIIKLLTALLTDWELAQPLLTLVEHNVFDEKTLDALVDIFKKAVANVTDTIKQAKLQKWLSYLEKLKIQEQQQRQQEESDLAGIEGMLQML